jgi:hypothetical protein
MNTQQITEAILHLHKEAIFTVIGDEVEWLDKSIKQPTRAEIEASYAAMISERQIAEAQKAADKAALLSKLGITEDEARLLLGGN